MSNAENSNNQSMSLKINVIYRGIIYRVKGIKVLCSVVLAVIILLVAIVGMGVWMLVTVYDDDKATLNSALNSTEVSSSSPKLTSDAAPSIDFKNANSIYFSTAASLEVTTPRARYRVKSKEEPHFERRPAPEPNLSIFGVGLYDANLQFGEGERIESREDKVPQEETLTNILPPQGKEEEEEVQVPIKAASLNENERVTTKMSPNDIATVIEESFTPNRRHLKSPEDPEPPRAPYPVRERWHGNGEKRGESGPMAPTRPHGRPLTVDNQDVAIQESFSDFGRGNEWDPQKTPIGFAHRHGVPSSKEIFTYLGPPVVGYGADPYKKLSKERMEEYDNFWKAYGNNGNPLNLRDPMIAKVTEDPQKVTMVPLLRGLRPTEEQYNLPLRPDAQAPPKDPAFYRRRGPGTRINFQPPFIPPPRLRERPPSPIVRPIQKPPNPDRRLYVGDFGNHGNQLSVPLTTTTIRSVVPLLGPLQEMYDYSKRLAASLLSFNTKTDGQIKETTDKLAQHGVKLIEDYSLIFEKQGGTLGKLSSLMPAPESLKDLDPFHLSLITWTFLDFWEFLIEKVGTLSTEDLKLLQERLAKLRKRKDSAMTQALVNETMSKMTEESGRSFSSPTPMEATSLKRIIDDLPQDDKDKFFEDIDTVDVDLSSIQDKNFLVDLFPQVSFEGVGKPTTENENPSVSNESDLSTILPVSEEEAQTEITTEAELIKKSETDHEMSQTPMASVDNSTLLNNVTLNVNDTAEESTAVLDHMKRKSVDVVEGRMWDPLGLFSSEGRMQFMQFAVKVVFNFGKVYLKKPYALDCAMLLFCKDLNQNSKQGGIDGMAAKVKSVGLKVLTQTDKQLREGDTLGEVWRSVTAWSPLQCEAMFPNCNGPKALEIVNEVALGSNNL